MLQVAVAIQDNYRSTNRNQLTIHAFEQLLKRLGFI
jgi:hypothetical protein